MLASCLEVLVCPVWWFLPENVNIGEVEAPLTLMITESVWFDPEVVERLAGDNCELSPSVKFKLTDREMVRLLTEACSVHPKLRTYLCDTLFPGSTNVLKDRLMYMGSSWLLATMNRWAVEERAKIIAQLQEKTGTCWSVKAKFPAIGLGWG